MNKFKFIYLPLIVFFAVRGIKAVREQQKALSDSQLRNVEVLANEEIGNKYICIGEGEVPCPITGKGVKIVGILSR